MIVIERIPESTDAADRATIRAAVDRRRGPSLNLFSLDPCAGLTPSQIALLAAFVRETDATTQEVPR